MCVLCSWVGARGGGGGVVVHGTQVEVRGHPEGVGVFPSTIQACLKFMIVGFLILTVITKISEAHCRLLVSPCCSLCLSTHL